MTAEVRHLHQKVLMRINGCQQLPAPSPTSTGVSAVSISMLVDGRVGVSPGGIEAVVGAHGVMSEELPPVRSVRSGV